MAKSSIYSRIIRRETHSPRSAAAITIAVILILLLAWVGTESVLDFVNAHALLLAPGTAFTALLDLSSSAQATLLASGITLVVVGLLLAAFAILPGARARHQLPSERYAVVVDDNVIANAILRRLSFESGLEPGQITVYLGRGSAQIRVVPSSGLPVDREALREAVSAELQSYDLRLRPKVIVARQGVVSR